MNCCWPSCAGPACWNSSGPCARLAPAGDEGRRQGRALPGGPGQDGQQAPGDRRGARQSARGHADRRKRARRHPAHAACPRRARSQGQARPPPKSPPRAVRRPRLRPRCLPPRPARPGRPPRRRSQRVCSRLRPGRCATAGSLEYAIHLVGASVSRSPTRSRAQKASE
jgi:hypothetical protein